VDTMSYNPYGVPDGAVDGYGFTGEMTDANGLLHLRARYYDPTVGVFASLDPFEGINSRPMSMNGYSWVEGNVANWTDPSGRQTYDPDRSISAVAECYAECLDNPCYFNLQARRETAWIGQCAYFFTNATGLFCDPFTGQCFSENPYISDGQCSELANMPYHPEYHRCLLRCAGIHGINPLDLTKPISNPKYLTIGGRFDLTRMVNSHGFLLDVNLETHFSIDKGLAFFIGISIENAISFGGENSGLLIGLIGWPKQIGETSIIYTGGGNIGITPWFPPLEGDITYSETKDIIFFLGSGNNLSPSIYQAVGVSIYLGGLYDLLNLNFFQALDEIWNNFNQIWDIYEGYR